jgi:hypothetical protein
LAPSTEAQIKIFVVPVLVAIVLGLATVAVGLALYIWNESRASSEAYRIATTARMDRMQDTLEQVGETLAVLTALQQRQERESQGPRE